MLLVTLPLVVQTIHVLINSAGSGVDAMMTREIDVALLVCVCVQLVVWLYAVLDHIVFLCTKYVHFSILRYHALVTIVAIT